MDRNPATVEIDEAGNNITATTTSATEAGANGGNGNNSTSGVGFHSIRDRIRFKRNPPIGNAASSSANNQNKSLKFDRRRGPLFNTNRSHRKGFYSCFPVRGAYFYYFIIFFAVFAFAMASMVLQSSITRIVSSRGWTEDRKSVSEGFRLGSTFKFFPGSRSLRLAEGDGLDQVRIQGNRLGLRPPRLAVILGNMKKGPQSLMLVTVMRNLQKLGYVLQIYAAKDGEARSTWEQIGGHISILQREHNGRIDWSTFEGVVADSLEAKETISSLMQEPFCSVPLIWIIQEDTLSNRLSVYEEMGWQYLMSNWQEALKRANVVVFPDFTLPMLYSVLDTGNFFVIPGSPVDVWAAESYSRTHVKLQLRTANGFNADDVVVLVVGSSFFYDQLSWDYAVAMHTLGPLLIKYARREASEGSFKFVFLCGNSTDGDALQELASRLGIPNGFIRHFGLNSNVNSMLLMADVFLYGSSQDEQGFPPLIIRAMTFEIPVIAPDIPVMKRYVTDGVHGLLFQRYNPEALMTAFSLLISEGKLSRFGQTVASYGRLLAKNIQALECMTGYARLLENALSFPSDVLLPGHASQLQQNEWEWDFFEKQTLQNTNDLLGTDVVEDSSFGESGIVYSLEDELPSLNDSTNISENGTQILAPDVPAESDWGVLKEIESLEDYERLEMEEHEGREDRNPGLWEDIYRNARKSEKLKFELNERDEGELERIGQPVCIYEIYNGAGAWPFLHHGSLYRGLSLSRKGRRPRSDDVDAVARLRILNDTYYRNLLCEIGGMFSVANKVDDIHKRPWIGFQSWRAAGRKVSLSTMAERVLEEKTQKETKGDVMYFWAYLDVDSGVTGNNHQLTFWSMCDILNGGHCSQMLGYKSFGVDFVA
ncbi:uncharacterized protein [Euphorbia lathyris]|uniref:uncharacterized protein isoform X2 n=1 Tax=Euphorbia lathyris TaxID=212925 RepID=UPI003314248B